MSVNQQRMMKEKKLEADDLDCEWWRNDAEKDLHVNVVRDKDNVWIGLDLKL